MLLATAISYQVSARWRGDDARTVGAAGIGHARREAEAESASVQRAAAEPGEEPFVVGGKQQVQVVRMDPRVVGVANIARVSQHVMVNLAHAVLNRCLGQLERKHRVG